MSYQFIPKSGDVVGLKTKSKKHLDGFDPSEEVIKGVENVGGTDIYEVFGLLLERKDLRPTLTKREIIDARDWILGCCFNESDAEIAKDLSSNEVERHVERNYEGGVEGFKASYYL